MYNFKKDDFHVGKNRVKFPLDFLKLINGTKKFSKFLCSSYDNTPNIFWRLLKVHLHDYYALSLSELMQSTQRINGFKGEVEKRPNNALNWILHQSISDAAETGDIAKAIEHKTKACLMWLKPMGLLFYKDN